MTTKTTTHMQPVTSSNIKAVGYDAATQAMTIEFHSGGRHVYSDVPPEKHAAMMEPGASVGKLFHSSIRHAHKSVAAPAAE